MPSGGVPQAAQDHDRPDEIALPEHSSQCEGDQISQSRQPGKGMNDQEIVDRRTNRETEPGNKEQASGGSRKIPTEESKDQEGDGKNQQQEERTPGHTV